MAQELKFHDPDEVDGVEDLNFPGYVHHFKVRGELNTLVEMDIISSDEADEAYNRWRDER